MRDPIFDAFPDPVVVVRDGVVRQVNARMGALLHVDASAIEGRPLAVIVDGVPADLGELEARGADVPEGTVAASHRMTFRVPETSRHVELDMRVSRAGPDLVLVGRDATEAATLHDTIGKLSTLHVSSRSSAMVDLDALLEESQAIFEGLGWNIALFAIEGEDARLRYSFFSVADDRAVAPLVQVVRMLESRAVPLDKTPRIAAVVREARGVFSWELARISGPLFAQLGPEANAVREVLHDAGFRRAAFAPVFVEGQVAFVLVVAGPHIAESDFAAVQLFAAMISAAEQIGGLREEAARQERHAALGQMAAQLAHEVRNPLAVLFQATSQVRRRVAAGEDVDELLAMIDDESRRLDRLVDDLVHFAAPLVPRMRDVHLGTLVRETVESLQPEMPDIVECVRICDSIEVLVRTDPVLLRQALAHLLTNACAFAGEDGYAEISASVELDERVRMRICNSGPPLPAEVARRVFEPFFTTKAKGTGLGLAVVRRLVEDLGGRVRLDPDERHTVFSVWLPAPG